MRKFHYAVRSNEISHRSGSYTLRMGTIAAVTHGGVILPGSAPIGTDFPGSGKTQTFPKALCPGRKKSASEIRGENYRPCCVVVRWYRNRQQWAYRQV